MMQSWAQRWFTVHDSSPEKSFILFLTSDSVTIYTKSPSGLAPVGVTSKAEIAKKY